MSLVGIHHVALRVFDLDEAAERWCRQFGLTVRERLDDRVLLRCGFEDYSVELIASGERPGFDHAGWQLAPGATAESLGLEEPLVDPDGYGVELVPWREPDDPFPDVARSRPSCPGSIRAGSATSTSSPRTSRASRRSTSTGSASA